MREGCVLDRLAALGIVSVVSLPCDRTRDSAPSPERFRIGRPHPEEDGIGILGGLAMVGARSVLHMQSSGSGTP